MVKEVSNTNLRNLNQPEDPPLVLTRSYCPPVPLEAQKGDPQPISTSNLTLKYIYANIYKYMSRERASEEVKCSQSQDKHLYFLDRLFCFP